MADNNEEILLNIVVSNDAATQAIFESQKAIDKLKQSQADLTTEFKKGSITSEEYSKKSTACKVAISQQTESIRANEKEIKNNIKTNTENIGSLVALRAQLSNNVKEFDNLSKAERESAKGKELQQSIADTMLTLTEAEQATGRFQRQVGKYPENMNGASQGITKMTGFLGKMSDQVGIVSPKISGMINTFVGFAGKTSLANDSISSMNTTLSNTGEAASAVEGFAGKASGSLNDLANTSKVAGAASTGAFSSIATGAKSLGAVFLAPPIIIIAAVIGAIVGAFMLLKKGFSLNDEASTKMAESFAVLEPIFDAIGKLAGYFAEGIANIVHFMAEATAGTIDFIAGLFGIEAGMKEAAKEAMNLVRAQDDLEEAERNFSVNSARRGVERAKLLAEVADKEKNNAEQRIAFLKDAGELDKQDLEDKKKLAEENSRILQAEADRKNDTSDDTADKLAAAKVRELNAQKDYFEGLKEINKKLSAAQNEMEAEQKAAYDKWKARKDDQLKKETELLRQLEDLVIAQIKDDYQRQIEAEKVKTERANADLLKRLKTEENLTSDAKKSINDIILINDQNLINKEAELIEKSLEANIKKEIEAKQKSIESSIQLSEKNSVDELNLKIARLQISKDAELNNENLTNIERLAIEDKFNSDSQSLTDSYLIGKEQRLRNHLSKEFELKILNAQNSGMFEDEQALLELEKTQAQYDALINMDATTKAAMYESQIEYEIAMAQSQKALITSQNLVTANQLKNMDTFVGAMRSVTNSLGTILSQAANDSYEAAKFAKALAIVNIGIALAEGLAGVVKVAAKSTTWYEMLAAIVSGVAAVGSAIVSAKKAFSDTPEPKQPSFATGGLIVGNGSGTSDSIKANVSNGESIINAQSTSMFTPLLSALNQAGGGVGFGNQQINSQLQGEEMLARAFAAGALMLPPPVLSLKEFHVANDRLTKLKEQ